MTKAEAGLWGVLLLIGLPIFLLFKFLEATGVIVPLIIVVAAIGIYLWYKSAKRKEKLQYLTEKYHDPELVQGIMNHLIWQGQSAEQLTDSIGPPAAVDNHVLKTKKKEVWKYLPQGGNRFDLRVTLEDDSVVGWDKKA